jgi:hypothetical protein
MTGVRILVPLLSGVEIVCTLVAESFAWLWVHFGDAGMRFLME